MVITAGEKVHVVVRRQFEDDLRRHFVGLVDNVTDSAMRVTGHVFIYDQGAGQFTRRNQQRTQIFGLVGAGLIITILPETVEIDALRYDADESGKRVLTDNKGFQMNISEFGILS